MRTVLVDKDQQLIDLIPTLVGANRIAIDTETTGLDWWIDVIIGMCFSVDGETGYYVPFGHEQGPQCSFPIVSYVVELIVRNPLSTKIFHNAKFDRHHILSTFGLEVLPPIEDTMVGAFLIDNTESKGLKYWTTRLFDDRLEKLDNRMEAIRKSRDPQSFVSLTPTEFFEYGAGDAIFTFKLWETFERELGDQIHLYSTEVELTDYVMMMERRGVLIDKDFLAYQGEKIDEWLPRTESELERVVGYKLNPRSPKQVADLLYTRLKMPILKYTDSGRPSTAEEVLLNLPDHPAIDLILRVRTLSKVKSTYVDGIISKLTTGNRLHCSFNQLGAETGRFSSSKPNLQNQPREGSVPVSIRSAFVPTPGTLLVFHDYKQVEMRVFAHYSRDSQLIRLCNEGYDFHLSTAASIFNKPREEVTKAERKFAKNVNFGYVYGIGPTSLARRLKIERNEAISFLRKYDRRFPGVPIFMRECRKEFERLGFVQNIFGRKRSIPFDKAYRSVNTKVQGTAADIIKNAMVRLIPLLRSCRVYPLMTVHDELIFEVPFDQLEKVREIKEVMEDFRLSVPIEVDVEFGCFSWGNKAKWDFDEFPLN